MLTAAGATGGGYYQLGNGGGGGGGAARGFQRRRQRRELRRITRRWRSLFPVSQRGRQLWRERYGADLAAAARA